jgi:hypothetical protein
MTRSDTLVRSLWEILVPVNDIISSEVIIRKRGQE